MGTKLTNTEVKWRVSSHIYRGRGTGMSETENERRKVDMQVASWTAKKKYKCPECGKVLRREHGLYKCDPCKLDVQLKMMMKF